MKFTNVKQLIIKFMGGGLINFPTRFLRWVKINGDTDGSDDGGGDSDNDNILILNHQEYANMMIISDAYKIYTVEEYINYESEEDLTISIYELDNQTVINDIKDYINEVGYIPIKIGSNAENTIVIDKFEDLNNHYEQHGDMFQDIKIHIHKTATLLPTINGGLL